MQESSFISAENFHLGLSNSRDYLKYSKFLHPSASLIPKPSDKQKNHCKSRFFSAIFFSNSFRTTTDSHKSIALYPVKTSITVRIRQEPKSTPIIPLQN